MSESSYESFNGYTIVEEASADSTSVTNKNPLSANILGLVYMVYAGMAAFGVVLAVCLDITDQPETCPNSLTFWTKFNFVLHASLFVFWGVGSIVVKCFGIAQWMVVTDCTMLVLGCIIAIIGTTQNGVGLYKAIGHECDTVVDLAVWQMLLFVAFVATINFTPRRV